MSGAISILIDARRVAADLSAKRGSGNFGAVYNAVLDGARAVAVKVSLRASRFELK
jgi:hypothetical protein